MSEVVRLFRFFKPAGYELTLKPDKNKMLFVGSLKLTGDIQAGQKVLRLHTKDLRIKQVKINNKIVKFKLLKQVDELRINLPAIKNQTIIVKINFSGNITKPMHGIYPCFGRNGEVILATQLESHHAREMFPCIDEPEAKAVFTLTLEAPKSEVVLANTLAQSTVLKGNKQVVTFEETPKMSTYLLAFVIGPLKMLQAVSKSGIIVRTWSSEDQIKNTGFALDVAAQSLEFYNRYFDIPYPLKKCDFVALPDFAAGAMENWGLITFRESCMLVDPKNTSLETKQYVASVIAHEIAHQWFGNLVTMRWWNDLWLNEGFASWIEFMAVDSIFPKWHMWTQFVASQQLTALRLDALNNTHPIEVKVPHPDTIRSIFDAISYDKGASVIHMLYYYLGEKLFRQGLVDYLNKYAYSNASTADLWQSLENTSKKPVARFMSAWVKQPGFPLVEIKRSRGRLKIAQRRFGQNKLDTVQTWPIPLLSDNINQSILDKPKLFIDEPKNLAKFKINRNQAGFYITKYWPKHYEVLGDMVKKGLLNENERIGLISDMLALTKHGELRLAYLVKLLLNFNNETSTPVWDSMALVLGDIRRVMGRDVRIAIKPLLRELTEKQVERLGWSENKKESYFDKLLRPTVLALSALGDETKVVEEAKQRFDNTEKLEELPSNLRSMILASVAKHGSKSEFDKMLKMLKTTASAEDRIILSGAMTNFPGVNEYRRAIDLIKSEHVKLQDVSYWLVGALANPHSRDETWDWVKKNWRWLKKNFSSDMSYPRLPVYIARSYSDSSIIKDYQEFFKSVYEPSLKLGIKQGLETIKLQTAWRKREEKFLLKWLKSL